MIQGIVVKWLFKAVYKAIKRKHDLKKIDEYVNKPNVLDKQMKQVQKNTNKALGYIEDIEKDIGILKSDSHPPIFSKKDYKDILKRIKKLERRNA
tara:strand:- start:415 stop:699 length:285 start_codon:yes stop_codon:yes gene_type:complete